MENQKPARGSACSVGSAKEKRLKPKVKKISKTIQVGRRGEQTSLVQTYHRLGSGGPPLKQFFGIFFEKKNSYYNAS